MIVLTKEGSLPLSVAYEYDEMNQVIAERIRKRLGSPPGALVRESVASCVERGRDLDAIRLLREKDQVSLAEAKLKIDQIKSKKKV